MRRLAYIPMIWSRRKDSFKKVHAWNKSAKIPSIWNLLVDKERSLNDVHVSGFVASEGRGLGITVGVDPKDSEDLIRDEKDSEVPMLGAFPNWRYRSPTAFKAILQRIIKHSDPNNPTKLTKEYSLENGQQLSREHLDRRVALAKMLLEMEDPPLVIVSDGKANKDFRPGAVGANGCVLPRLEPCYSAKRLG